MARYKPYPHEQIIMVPVSLSQQAVPCKGYNLSESRWRIYMTPLQRWGILLYMISAPWTLAFALLGRNILGMGLLTILGAVLFSLDNSSVEPIIPLTKRHRTGIVLFNIGWILVVVFGTTFSWFATVPFLILIVGAGNWVMNTTKSQ